MAKQETQITTVTMTDGRIVEFAGKRKLLKSSQVTADGQIQVRLDFVNGATRLFTIPVAMVAKFAAHGAEQKLGDEISGLKGENGGEADIDDCVLTMDELIDRLYEGEWGVKREANGLAGTSILIRAMVELYAGAKTVQDVKAFLKDKTVAEKKALRLNAKIRPIVERLEAEKLSKSAVGQIDSDALLDSIGQ
jgi:hypothetical protein